MRVDLNADVGEGQEGQESASDAAVLAHVTSANIACGFHAGGPATMRSTVDLSRTKGVAIGAHPAFADREGFGRREVRIGIKELEDLVVYQIRTLAAIAQEQGMRLQHVKPHGALYNMAARDRSLAETVARAVRAFDPSIILVGLAGSASIVAAERLGLRAASEGFADRAYCADGTLVPRSEPGAVIHDADEVAHRALSMVREGVVVAITGERVRLHVETICVHGDTPDAPQLAAALRSALIAAGVTVSALSAG